MIRIDCRGVSTDGLADSEEIHAARDCFTRHGYVILDRIVPEARVNALHAEFNERYAHFLQDRETEESLEVGQRRFMVPVHFSGGFGDPLIFANPYVVALVRQLLGHNAILEAYGAINSLSGAEAQHVHRDGTMLFGTDLAPLLPAHALTFALPLIEMNELHGTTAIWPDSHRWKEENSQVPPEIPVIPVGSCLLWDFRLLHSGTVNRSDRHRPMVYATYARHWYRDALNFQKNTQKRLVFTPDFFDSIPEDTRVLLSHARGTPSNGTA